MGFDDEYPPPVELMRLMADTLASIPEGGMNVESLPPYFRVEHMQMFGAVVVDGNIVRRGPEWEAVIDYFRESARILGDKD
jgi:hypothetical protein